MAINSVDTPEIQSDTRETDLRQMVVPMRPPLEGMSNPSLIRLVMGDTSVVTGATASDDLQEVYTELAAKQLANFPESISSVNALIVAASLTPYDPVRAECLKSISMLDKEVAVIVALSYLQHPDAHLRAYSVPLLAAVDSVLAESVSDRLRSDSSEMVRDETYAALTGVSTKQKDSAATQFIEIDTDILAAMFLFQNPRTHSPEIFTDSMSRIRSTGAKEAISCLFLVSPDAGDEVMQAAFNYLKTSNPRFVEALHAAFPHTFVKQPT